MIADLLPQWLSEDALLAWWRESSRLVRFWGPVIGLPNFAAPVGLLGSVLALLILSGVAVAGLATFVSAALMLYMMLTEVFGFSIDLVLA